MVRLVIADDHIVLREALSEMLTARGEYDIIAQAADGKELLSLLQNGEQADLIIMDLAMPRLNGVETLQELQKEGKEVPVLVLTADEGQHSVRQAMQAGARGYLPKHAGLRELEFAIQSVLNGQTYLSPTVTESLMKNGGKEGMMDNPLRVLTKREVEILKHLADGKPNRDIAKLLHISIRTVDTHRSNILKKLEVKTNAELVKLAISHGLIDL